MDKTIDNTIFENKTIETLVEKYNYRKEDRTGLSNIEIAILEKKEKTALLVKYWRYYPDKFIDYLVSLDARKIKFSLNVTQRLHLRAMFRSKRIFINASRSTGKTFTMVLGGVIRSILYPKSVVGMVTSTLRQTQALMESKLSDILDLIPIISGEIDMRESRVTASASRAEIIFFNGSKIRAVAISEAERGGRLTDVIADEVGTYDISNGGTGKTKGADFETIIKPMVTVQRKEQIENNEIRNTFSYICTSVGEETFANNTAKSMKQTMLTDYKTMKTKRNKYFDAFYIGNSIITAIYSGRLKYDNLKHDLEPYLNDVEEGKPDTERLNAMYNEFFSFWGGQSGYPLVNEITMRKKMNLLLCEYNYIELTEEQREEKGYGSIEYLLAIDYSQSTRLASANTIMTVFKLYYGRGSAAENLMQVEIVNMVKLLKSEDKDNARYQAIQIKQAQVEYKASYVVIDGNGNGKALISNLKTISADKEDEHLPLIVREDEEIRNADNVKRILTVIEATSTGNTDTEETQIINNFIKYLNTEYIGFNIIKPYKQMLEDGEVEGILGDGSIRKYQGNIEIDHFIDEVKNLEKIPHINNPDKIRLKFKSLSYQKDRYSSIAYGLIKVTRILEESLRSHTERMFSDYKDVEAVPSLIIKKRNRNLLGG